jgi:hypothetical protein
MSVQCVCGKKKEESVCKFYNIETYVFCKLCIDAFSEPLNIPNGNKSKRYRKWEGFMGIIDLEAPIK